LVSLSSAVLTTACLVSSYRVTRGRNDPGQLSTDGVLKLRSVLQLWGDRTFPLVQGRSFQGKDRRGRRDSTPNERSVQISANDATQLCRVMQLQHARELRLCRRAVEFSAASQSTSRRRRSSFAFGNPSQVRRQLLRLFVSSNFK